MCPMEWSGLGPSGVGWLEDDDKAMLPTEDAEADACGMADPDLAWFGCALVGLD